MKTCKHCGEPVPRKYVKKGWDYCQPSCRKVRIRELKRKFREAPFETSFLEGCNPITGREGGAHRPDCEFPDCQQERRRRVDDLKRILLTPPGGRSELDQKMLEVAGLAEIAGDSDEFSLVLISILSETLASEE